MQKLVERRDFVAAERFAIDEAVLAIERERRLEGWARSSFEAQAAIAAPSRDVEDVIEQRRSHALAQMRRISSHRFYFARDRIKLLEGRHAEQLVVMPRRVDPDIGGLET